MTCQYIFKRGANKGIPCGLKTVESCNFCRVHNGKVLELTKLPTLALSKIVEHMSFSDDLHESRSIFHKLDVLSKSCKEYHDLINEATWERLYNQLNPDINHVCDEFYTMSFKKRLHLLLDVGCQRCNVPKITKIYWPFPVRVCTNCFDKISIRDYVLKHEYKTEYASAFYIDGFTWSRFHGYNNFRYYWKYLVEKDIGCTLIEKKRHYDQNSLNHKLAIASSLNVSYDDVKHLMDYSDFPDKLYIHKCYFVSQAELHIKTWFKNKHKGSLYYDILHDCSKIKNKKDYEEWIALFERKQVDYLQTINKEVYITSK